MYQELDIIYLLYIIFKFPKTILSCCKLDFYPHHNLYSLRINNIGSEDVRNTQDANTAWLQMKSKLNESLNKYMSPMAEINHSKNVNFSMIERSSRPCSPLVSPRSPAQSPRPVRTSGDSFL